MKAAVLGADSALGKKLVLDAEALGIQVTIIVSNPSDLVGTGPIIIKEYDELEQNDLKNFAVFIDAISFPYLQRFKDDPPILRLSSLVSSDCRYLAVGACSLLYEDSRRLRRLGQNPDVYFDFYDKEQAALELELFEKIHKLEHFNYTLLCPPLLVDYEGKRSLGVQLSDDVLPLSAFGSCKATLGDLSAGMMEILKLGGPGRKIVGMRAL